MKYMGSKNKYAKEILPIILKDRKSDQYYVEPFVGGFNLIDKVSGPRIANDSNFYLIELFKAIQLGWQPPNEVSEEEYQEIKKLKDAQYPAYLVGFVGFGCSYSGKWFGGYARGKSNSGESRNYCLESKKNILKQFWNIQDVEIFNVSYQELEIPANSIIYSDPPYQNTTNYSNSSQFDHSVFWDWCRKKKAEGHSVFVSEYSAPEDFECLWSKEVFNSLTKETGGKIGVEKLFRCN